MAIPVIGVAALLVAVSGNARAEDGPSGSAPAEPARAASVCEVLAAEAKGECETGRLLYETHDYANAKIKFERAHALSGQPRLLWNIIVCEKELRHYARVRVLTQQYLAEVPDLPDERKQQAGDLLTALASLVSPLDIVVTPPGATVVVDDREVGVSPLSGPVLVDIGTRTVRATMQGYADAQQRVDVAGGHGATVTLKLTKKQARLVVDARPGDAIRLDGKLVGTGHWDASLGPGPHEVRVSAPGYRPYIARIPLRPDEVRPLSVRLEEEPSPIPAWVWIGGSVALAAGGAVGGWLLLRPSDQPAPDPIVGTIEPGLVRLSRTGR